jgi:endonuclease YncB( thermonuclease family)
MVRAFSAAALVAFTVSVVALAKTAPPAQPFQRIDGCIYKPQRWNDGDSFHVILPDQKELIFRLYFVDTPEEERIYADRITEQAAYFGSPDSAVEVGREASEFTKKALAKPFTIYTRWRRALGRSALWRYYAIVITAEGKALNELLVSAGLAQIYGTRTPPTGRARFARISGVFARIRERSEGGGAGRVEQNAAINAENWNQSRVASSSKKAVSSSLE